MSGIDIISFMLSAVALILTLYIFNMIVLKKDNYLSPITSPMSNILLSIDKMNNNMPFLTTPSSIILDKELELNNGLKIGEKGKYTLVVDKDKNLTLNRDKLPILKFIDMNENGKGYVDTKICFDEKCDKYLNINKLYGITTNQETVKL